MTSKNVKRASVRTGESVKVHYGNHDFTGKVVKQGATPRTGKYVTVRFDFDSETAIETDFGLDQVRVAG